MIARSKLVDVERNRGARPAVPESRLLPGGARWVMSLALALTAHAGVLYALLRTPAELMPGGAGHFIEAISVTLASSDVLESRASDPAPVAPSPRASVEDSDGTPDHTAAPAAERREEKKEQVRDEPAQAAEAVLEVAPHEEARRQQQASAAAAEGGAVARTQASTARETKSSAPAAASAGTARDYSRYVALALSRAKPKGVGGLGTVQVRFTIAADGALAAAEVARSSGSHSLDAAAVAAVRRTRFPAPPAGMSVADLTYQVPYHFR